jgi:hypothetical protein
LTFPTSSPPSNFQITRKELWKYPASTSASPTIPAPAGGAPFHITPEFTNAANGFFGGRILRFLKGAGFALAIERPASTSNQITISFNPTQICGV